MSVDRSDHVLIVVVLYATVMFYCSYHLCTNNCCYGEGDTVNIIKVTRLY